MAYRYGSREQISFLPSSIDEYVGSSDPVRAYNVFIDALDLRKLGIKINIYQVGNSSFDPRAMLKLLVYGYSYGERSSRKLERACYHNLSFIWLTGGLKPDHKTISEFRRKNKKALRKVLKQCARLCIDLGLIEGNALFVDGSKFRGNAGIKNSWDRDRCDKVLKKVDQQIEKILAECDRADIEETDDPSLVKLKDELQNQETLKKKVESIVYELGRSNKTSINSTDPDCVKIKSRQGSHAGYNVQSVVDEKHGLIVHSDVVSENSDRNQFSSQIEQANENLNKKCSIACGDAGYDNSKELKQINDQEIKVIVPTQKQVSKKELPPFDKERFHFDKQRDCYICPQGHQLEYSCTRKDDERKVYRIKGSGICQNCEHFTQCTKDKKGRQITRSALEETREKLKKQYEEFDSQQTYHLRQQKVELPFGHIKYNLKAGSFLLRGLDGVKAETSILSTCFNVARMISIFGVSGLIEKLS